MRPRVLDVARTPAEQVALDAQQPVMVADVIDGANESAEADQKESGEQDAFMRHAVALCGGRPRRGGASVGRRQSLKSNGMPRSSHSAISAMTLIGGMARRERQSSIAR